MALKSNGKVEAWGTGGQTNVPAGLSNVIAIAAGGSHSMALKSDGKVEAWGANYSGQTNVPVGLSNVMAIAAGNSHSMALRSNGTVVAWGSAYYGQTNVPWGLSNVIAIAAGSDCSLSLTYSPPSRPSNDNFTNAIPVIGSVATVVGSNTNASQEVGEGNHSNFEGGGVSVWWSWTAPSNGMLNIDTIGSTFIPELAVYTGINISNLTNRAADYGGGGNRSRILNLPVTANLKYYIALDGYAGQQGGISMSLSCYFNDNFTNRQNMTGTNVVFQASTSNATNEPNEPAHLLFNSPAHSVWYSWKAPFTGGVVIFGDGTLAGDDDLDGAILAVYSGTNFPTMTRLVSDVSLDQSSSSPSIEGYDGPAYVRVVFNAISNQTYQIAVDGLDGGQGILNLSLAIFTPPSNDSFSNRLAIVGNSYTTNGTFIGATRDPGELEHAPPFGFPQTVWWSWTAPTNNGVTNSEVLLMASGVSFAPGIEVYSATNLTNSPISYGKIELINGLPESPFGGPPNPMTRMALFTAQAGATYNIVLSGTQFTPLGGFVSPRYGDFNFSLQNRVLAMTVTNESWQTNETNDTLFDADVIVRNFGATAGGPLRVSVSAISGVSVTRIDAEATLGGDALIITNLPSVPFVLAPGQSNLIHISGVVPPPSYITASDAKGYAAFAQLQEEKGSGQWFSVDQAFVVYGVWPTNTGARSPNGPGGGVIRLDPALTGDEFNPLTNVAVLGPLVVPEGRQTNYIGLAQFSDGFQTNFTGTVWLSTLFNITNGLLSTASITSNMPVILTTKYSSEGFEYSANLGILVSNLPAPTLKSLQVTSNGNFILQLDGVANRKHVIQATTNLALPVTWTSLLTNTAGANGLLNFTNLIGTNRQRFFRAKETE